MKAIHPILGYHLPSFYNCKEDTYKGDEFIYHRLNENDKYDSIVIGNPSHLNVIRKNRMLGNL